MIGKFAISGGGFGGLCRYVLRERPQDLQRLEREGRTPDDARIVGGTLAGNNAYALTRELEWAAALHPGVSEPAFHASLRLPEREAGRLSDRAWGEVGREYAERMGFGNAPYVVVCHGRDHAHIVASRVDLAGERVDMWRDRYRSQEILREIERDRHLEHPREREPDSVRDAERRDLRERVDRAIQAGNGSRAGFDRALEREGVRADWKESHRDGQIVGVRFGRAGDEHDWGYKGSQLGKDYGGRALQKRIADRDHTRERERARERDDGRGWERERTRDYDDDWSR